MWIRFDTMINSSQNYGKERKMFNHMFGSLIMIVSLHRTSSHPIIEACFVSSVMKESLNCFRLRGSMSQ